MRAGLGAPLEGRHVEAGLLGPTLRGHWRGTLWTAAVCLTLFVAMGAQTLLAPPPEGLKPHRFVIRIAFLAIAAALLGALGAQMAAVPAQLFRLARGPRSIALHAEELARDVLQHAALLGTPRVAMTWEDGEEPWLHVASSVGGEVTLGAARRQGGLRWRSAWWWPTTTR